MVRETRSLFRTYKFHVGFPGLWYGSILWISTDYTFLSGFVDTSKVSLGIL